MAKVFSPRLGVLSGFVFNTVNWGTLPLASVGRLILFFKVGIVFRGCNWSTIGRWNCLVFIGSEFKFHIKG